MSRLDMSLDLPAAPACPSWCGGHDQPTRVSGWDFVHPAGVYKTCEKTFDGLPREAVFVRVEQVAEIHWEGAPRGTNMQPLVRPAEVRLNDCDGLTPASARLLARHLLEAADIAESAR